MPTAVRRRRLPCWRLATRRWHLTSYRAAWRAWRGVATASSSAVMRKTFQAHIYAGLLFRRRQRLDRHLGTGERHLPAVGFAAHRDGRKGALEGPGPAHGDAPHLCQHEGAVLEPGAVAVLLRR